MDGRLGIEHDRAVLQRIVVTLVAMTGLEPRACRGGERDGGRATLPRRLRNAVLKLLRPAESAARRLIIAASHGIAPEKLSFDKLRMRRSTQEVRPASIIVRNGKGTGIVMTRALLAELASMKPLIPSPEPVEGELAEGELVEGAKKRLPLFDAMRRVQTRRWKRQTAVPRIMAHAGPDIHAVSVPPLPKPHDLLPAEPLRLRLEALKGALENLPREALRFARWRARQALREALVRQAHHEGVSNTDRLKQKLLANRGIAAPKRRPFKQRWPLRFGHPPGALGCAGHELHAVLSHADALARWALDQPVVDTS